MMIQVEYADSIMEEAVLLERSVHPGMSEYLNWRNNSSGVHLVYCSLNWRAFNLILLNSDSYRSPFWKRHGSQIHEPNRLHFCTASQSQHSV
jgi:hypothetical protein